MEYHFKAHKDKNGLWAECIELKGCDTQSKNNTMEDLYKNMQEALNLFLNEPAGSNQIHPLPNKAVKGSGIIKVKVDPRIAFAALLRSIRIKNKMTQKEVALKLGYKNIWSYQILESSKKNNPSLETISKIKEIFPDFDINLIV